MTSSTFRRLFTYREQDFDPALIDHPDLCRLRPNLIRSRLEALKAVIEGKFGSLWKFWLPSPTSPKKNKP